MIVFATIGGFDFAHFSYLIWSEIVESVYELGSAQDKNTDKKIETFFF